MTGFIQGSCDRVVARWLERYLLYDPLLHYVGHQLQVDGSCYGAGGVTPEMSVPVRQHTFDLLDLEETSDSG